MPPKTTAKPSTTEQIAIVSPVVDPAPPAPTNGTLHAEPTPIPPPEPQPAPAPTPELSDADQFIEIIGEFETLIRSQTRTFIGYFAQRGNVAFKAMNLKFKKARSKDTRAKLRSATLDVLHASAIANYDPSAEQKPKIQRWLEIAAVTNAFPEALGLASVSACDSLTALISRVDPPAFWTDPESYELRRQFTGKEDEIRAMITRAVSERWTASQVDEGIDIINGAVLPDPSEKKKLVDTVKAARALAISVVEKIQAVEIDATTFVEEFQTQLAVYAYTLAKGKNGTGIDTLILRKNGNK